MLWDNYELISPNRIKRFVLHIQYENKTSLQVAVFLIVFLIISFAFHNLFPLGNCTTVFHICIGCWRGRSNERASFIDENTVVGSRRSEMLFKVCLHCNEWHQQQFASQTKNKNIRFLFTQISRISIERFGRILLKFLRQNSAPKLCAHTTGCTTDPC